MPPVNKRKPKKTYNTFTQENLESALQELGQGRISYREAECKYGVPKSTLARKFTGRQGRNPGRPNVFNLTEEHLFVSGIVTAAKWGFPLTTLDIRLIAKSYLDKRGMRIPRFKDNTPGRKWAKCFLRRYKEQLSERLAQNIKRNRAGLSKETINDYFNHLESTLAGVTPERILNYDETNFTDDPGSSKVIVRRGTKHAERVLDTSKSSTSVMFTIAGDGSLLPIYVVYKAVHLHDTWCSHGPAHTVYNRSRSGWFDACLFEDWYFKIALPYFKRLEGPGKKILLGDNLSSHLSLKVIQSCENNNIEFILLPPNGTHLLQPLDVSFFGPLKKHWKEHLLQWKKRHRGILPKDVFPSILKKTIMGLERTAESTIKSGFRTCGIIPLDRQVVLKKLPDEEKEDEVHNINEHVSSSFTELLKNSRLSENEPQRKRRKRLNVPPGQGITAADLHTQNNGNIEYNDIEGENDQPQEIDDSEEGNDQTQEIDDSEETLAMVDENDQNLTSENENGVDQNENLETGEEIKEGVFVICKFTYNKGTKKETYKEFVSKVLRVTDDLYEISCLRFDSRTAAYIFPQIEDVNEVQKNQITRVLNAPKVFRGRYKFDSIDLC